MSKKKFFTQVRLAGRPVALRFTDTDHNDYVLKVGASGDPIMEGFLWLEQVKYSCHLPVLDRQGAAELAQVLLRYSATGVLVSRRVRPEREVCPKCGKRSLDPRATWEEGEGERHVRYLGDKCRSKSCTYRLGLYVSVLKK